MSLSLAAAVLVGLGGTAGAVSRHVVDQRIVGTWSTFTVNVLGSFVLALVAFGGVGGTAGLLLGTGLAGSFTTFSSFSYETVRLWETGERCRAAVNAVSSILGAVLAIGLARALLAVAA